MRSDGNADIFIYDLGSVKEIHHQMENKEYVEYEYDMNQFKVDSKLVTLNDVLINPMQYIDFEPEKEKSELEKIKELQEQNDMLTQCILEISELVYQ